MHVVDSLGVGGAERVVVNNINLFKDYNHVVITLTPEMDLADELPSNVAIECLNFNSKTKFFEAVSKLKSLIKKFKPTVVHTHLLWSSWIARVAKPKSLPLVATIHSNLSQGAFSKNYHSRIIEQWTSKKVDAFITVSNTVQNDYLKHINYKGVIETIYNFNALQNIKPSTISYESGHKLKIICVGNIIPVKNHKLLIHALEKMPRDIRDNIAIDIYGHGELSEELSNSVSNNNLPVSIRPASRLELESLFSHYHVYCMPSLHEGMPMALLEAITAELPIMASNIPIFNELLQDKGLLFGLNNVHDFIQKIELIIKGKIDLKKYQEYSKILKQQLTTKETYILQHYRIYESVIGDKPY